MKFSRIVAAGMFAAMLVGTVPVQANGILDWLSGLFESDKPAQRTQQRENRWQQQPQAPQHQGQNRTQFRAPRGGMYGRRGQQRYPNRRPQAQPAQPNRTQPRTPYVAQQPVRNNPRVKSVNKKEAFMKSIGLVGVGIAVTLLFTQTGLVDKLRDLLGLARPARDVNNLATEFRETAEAVRDLGNNFMNTMDEQGNNRRRPARNN